MQNIKNILEHIIRHCNPKERSFYDSLMLQNGGRLLIDKIPKNIDKVLDRVAFTKITDD